MSFILDALRKSETERQHQDAPGIASIPQGGSARSGPRWMWLAVGLLVVNLAVLSGVLLKMNGDDSPTDANSAQQVPAAADAPAAPPTSATRADVTAAASVDSATREPDAPAQDAESPDTVTAVAASPVQEAVVDDVSATDEVSRVPPARSAEPTSSVISSFNELRASGVLNLPDLHLDIHVYSGQPDERFVFVNMAKYRENATLSEGPVVQEITPEGVILDYRGTDFLLPRE